MVELSGVMRAEMLEKVISERRTEMKPLPPFVVWDQNGLQVHVWYYHGLNPVRHWVQLKDNESLTYDL